MRLLLFLVPTRTQIANRSNVRSPKCDLARIRPCPLHIAIHHSRHSENDAAVFSIRAESGGGAWCPQRQINAETKEWLQIDLGVDTLITAVETQGRYGGGHGVEYPPGYSIEYWRPSLANWARYRDRHANEVGSRGDHHLFLPLVTSTASTDHHRSVVGDEG